MASTRQIRSRIRVAKNIQQITKAMKMVAAARLRRAQEAVVSARPYSEQLREVVSSLASNVGSTVQHPLLRDTGAPPTSVGVLLVTGDRGLAGSYNTNSIKRALETIKPYSVEQVKFVCVGRRGANFFRRRGCDIVAEFPVPGHGMKFADAKGIAKAARSLFEEEKVDVLHLVYTRFLSALSQRPQSIQLLPLAPPEPKEGAKAAEKSDVIFEPSPEAILEELLVRYVDTLVFQAILESTASFFGAQMTSMSSATDNAGKMISALTLSLNRARQATITKEIAEIVGGADALKA